MKKITLLLINLIFITSFTNAQDFQNENFEGLTIGNVGTDPNGTTPGQGDFLTITTSLQNSDFQIINEGGSHGKVLEITGPSNDSGGQLIWKNGLGTSWASRTSGNNILEFEFDLFSGPVTSSKNITNIAFYDSNNNTIFGFLYIPETKLLVGQIYLDNAGTINTYFINLENDDSETFLTPNTWYSLGVAFNKTTGEVTFRGPNFYWSIQGAAAGLDPFDYDFTIIGDLDTGNNLGFNFKFDNLKISAVATENLLSYDDLDNLLSESIKLYPNPAKNVINISAANNLNLSRLDITDMKGRLIKSLSIENISSRKGINISELNKGLYLLNIYSKDGMVTKKIIKE